MILKDPILTNVEESSHNHPWQKVTRIYAIDYSRGGTPGTVLLKINENLDSSICQLPYHYSLHYWEKGEWCWVLDKHDNKGLTWEVTEEMASIFLTYFIGGKDD